MGEKLQPVEVLLVGCSQIEQFLHLLDWVVALKGLFRTSFQRHRYTFRLVALPAFHRILHVEFHRAKQPSMTKVRLNAVPLSALQDHGQKVLHEQASENVQGGEFGVETDLRLAVEH